MFEHWLTEKASHSDYVEQISGVFLVIRFPPWRLYFTSGYLLCIWFLWNGKVGLSLFFFCCFFLFEPWGFCPLQPTINRMPSGRTAFQLLPFLLPLRCTFQFYSSLPALPLIPSEPSDVPHVTQLLEWLPAETALLGFAPLAVDGAMAHHLRHCPYHFRLFKTELVSSQELPESHYGQPLQSLKILGAASSSSL